MATINELLSPKAGERYIILSEKQQEMPERFRIKKFGIKDSGTGKQYVELDCVDEDGSKLKVSVFQRDVKLCVQQWGTNPDNWGYMKFVLNMTGNRYYLAPHENQVDFHTDFGD